MVDSLVFDLDGTLVDSAPGIERCLRRALAEVAPDRAPHLPVGLIGPPVREMVARLLPGADDAVVDAGVAVFRRCYDGGGWRETVPYAGAGEMLAVLSSTGHRLFIVTNKPTRPTRRILAHLGWDVLFDGVVCRDSLTPPFDDKLAALGHLVSSESLDAGATLFVGDTLEDAIAAEAQGLAFVYAAYGYGDVLVSVRACATITEPRALADVIDRAAR